MAKFKTTDAEGKEIEVEIDITADNIPKEVKDQIIRSAQGIAYGNVDTVADRYGYKKPDGVEKTSDFIEHILKTEKEKLVELQRQVEEAKSGQNPPEDVVKLQEQIATQNKIIENQKAEITNKDKTYKETVLHSKIDAELSGIDIAVPAHITEEADVKYYKDVQRDVIKNKILSSYEVKFDDAGNSYRVLKGNEAELNTKNEIASIRDIAERDFKSWIAAPGSKGNAGGTGGQGKPEGGNPKAYKTFEDVAAAAQEKGHAVGGPDWTKFVNDTTKELGIDQE